MKNYLEIKSFGQIDIQAFTLIGASTKRNDETKIGLYGSGNKYSIATMLRQRIDFKVFSGEDEIVFTTRNQKFREQEFDVILVNGQETSLTTTMGGEDWNTAFAPIREIYSNALDEDDDATLTKVSSILPEKGYTKFFIELTKDVKHFYDNIHLYFCKHNPKVLFSNSYGSIYTNTDGGNIRVFRKGILSHFDNKNKALLHYNFEDLDINESRVVKYVWQINNKMANIWKTCTNEELINTLLLRLNGGNAGYLEHSIGWDSWCSFTPQWYNVCKDKKFAPIEYTDMFSEAELKGAYTLPMKLLKELKTAFTDLNVLGISSKSDGAFVTVKPKQILLDKVTDAMGKLYETEYKHRFDNPIIEYVKFSNDSTLGLAENEKIYLSVKLDVYSIDEIAKIIIEENEHNLSGLEDETRAFQNHLFNLYYSELTSNKLKYEI
jgi:hypothetical protein